jgi:hypothetical protein
MRRAFLRIVAVVGKCCFRCADGEAMPAIIKFVSPEKKPAAPIPSSKRPALAVALLDLPPEFRCSAIGGDAFSAERPVLVFCGNFKGVSKSEKPRSGPPLMILLCAGLYQQSKKSWPVSSELLFGMAQSLEMAANNATKPFG